MNKVRVGINGYGVIGKRIADAVKLQDEKKGLDILTVALAVPTTLGHLHVAFLRLKKEISTGEVLKILKTSPRIVPVRHKDGISAENQLVELMRDLGRPRADMWEVAIRAVGGTEEDPQASIGKTNNSLGIVSAFNV